MDQPQPFLFIFVLFQHKFGQIKHPTLNLIEWEILPFLVFHYKYLFKDLNLQPFDRRTTAANRATNVCQKV